MQRIIPPAYLPYITAAIAGITLSGDLLYLQQVAEGTQLAKDDSFSNMVFTFPDGWKPPLHTPSCLEWLRAFFDGMTVADHKLQIEGIDDWIVLSEILNEKGDKYHWFVEIAEGWAPPPNPVWNRDLRRRLPSECDRAWLVEQLGKLYGMSPEYLADLPREQLVPLIDLAPDISGITIHQRWMRREPKYWWQRALWSIFGVPMAWRFEVDVMTTHTWQYAVRDTLEEARSCALEVSEQFARLAAGGTRYTVVTRYNVQEIASCIQRFLARCYWTRITNDWSISSYNVRNHWRLQRPLIDSTTPPVYYEWSPNLRLWDAPGYIAIFNVGSQYTFPVILQHDSTSLFPRTLVTFEPSQLTLRIRQANDPKGTQDRTVVYVREGLITLSVGEQDEYGVYQGE
jgi:hypothetical protein